MPLSVKKKYERCLSLTMNALERLEVVKKCSVSNTLLKFAKDYYNDAKHYAGKGDYVTALEAIAYAHGFIDAGVLAGYFEIGGYHLKTIRD